jgi:hypothetical protein
MSDAQHTPPEAGEGFRPVPDDHEHKETRHV